MPFVLDDSVVSGWYLELALRLRCPIATQDEGLRFAALASGVRVLPQP